MNIKNLILCCLLVGGILACDDDNTFEPFDYEGQAIIDDAALVEYMNTHYYNEESEMIETIDAGQVAFSAKSQVIKVLNNEIEYNLYYIVNEDQGVGYQPGRLDRVLTTYKGELLSGGVFDERKSITVGNPWFSLESVIKGWSYGFPKFKGGVVVPQSGEPGPIEFTDYGSGFLFIPSGLGYGPSGQSGIPASSPLVFTVALHDASASDHDNDNVSSLKEDRNGDDDYFNDDTDGDGTPDYFDVDDDGDGVLTKDEDPNGDEDPTNDDTDGDGTPDYLDTDN